MLSIGNGNNVSFWLYATVASVVIAFVLAVTNAVCGFFSGLLLRRIRRPLPRVALGGLAVVAILTLGAVATVFVFAVSPQLGAWWPLALVSSLSSALCLALMVAFVRVKPPQPESSSNRRIPGIRL
ncbi:hypothetical protein ACEXQE_10045 [Herbiconiux sp. P17]|uniref:hypothetical protein n=1 Tax=Herbiconiux wuyangfengii TaxID=3342794 RepID=UPI0035BA393E